MNCLLPLRTAAIVGTLLLAGPAAADNEFPSFLPGQWSFTSTFNTPGAAKPQVRTISKCTNPSEDIKSKWDKLATTSCKFSPVTHAGNRYSYTSVCERNGLTMLAKSSIIVESTSAYRVETESRTDSQQRKESIVAQRVGDCAT